MGLLNEQNLSQASLRQPIPVDDMTSSSSVETVSSETVQFYYSNSGARTQDAGQAAGVAVHANLANKNILDAPGGAIASHKDTSLSFTSTAFTTEVKFPYRTWESLQFDTWANKLSAITAGLAQGEYCVNYRTGDMFGVKASTQTSLANATYKVNAGRAVVTATVSGMATLTEQQSQTSLLTTIDTDTGNIDTKLGTIDDPVDTTNTLFRVTNKWVAAGTYAPSYDVSTALEASTVTKASAGLLLSVQGRIDSTLVSGTYYVQFLNASSLPADGAVTHLIAPLKVIHTTGTDSNFVIDFTKEGGRVASTGIVVCLSTTEFTKTIGGSYLSTTVAYV